MFRNALIILTLIMGFCLPVQVQADVLGQITMKDGSIIHGDVVDMVGGTLQVKALFGAGDPFQLKWEEVANLATSQAITLTLTEGVTLQGTAQKGEPGVILLHTPVVSILIPIQMSSITAINPPKKNPVTYTGNVNIGGSLTSGNTDLRNANLTGELVARSKTLRLSILARWLYSEDSGSVNVRNAFGTIKLDFFITEKFYFYTSALFEQDTFQDLQLRTSINAGPGYQFIDKGDYTSPHLKDLELYGEIGLGFFNEDFKIAPDQNFVTGRWAVKFDWPVTSRIFIFHQHQGFPSLETVSDFYVTSQQGIRFTIIDNFISTFQVNWKYDNTPSPGNKSSDFQYLLTLGYSFET